MDWLRLAAIVSLFVVSVLGGGAIVRVFVAAGDLRAAVTFLAVLVVLVLVTAAGAKRRRWRRNPYW